MSILACFKRGQNLFAASLLLAAGNAYATDNITIHENGEDQDTAGWSVYDNTPIGTITNIIDNSGNRVIQLAGEGTTTGTGTGFKFLLPTPQTENFILQWKMKFAKDFIFEIHCKTSDGLRILKYSTKDSSDLGAGVQIDYTLDLPDSSSKWLTIRRNVQQDILNAQPEVSLYEIFKIQIRGYGQLDDIVSFGYADSDGDLIPDTLEALGIDGDLQGDDDLDNDGISNIEEVILGTPVDNPDADADSLLDGFELYNSLTNPQDPDSDDNGIADPDENPDGDAYTNLQEQENGTAALSYTHDDGYVYDYQSLFSGIDISNWFGPDDMSIQNIDGTSVIDLPSWSKVYTYSHPEYLYNRNIVEWAFQSESAAPYGNHETVIHIMTNEGMKYLVYVPYVPVGRLDTVRRFWIPYGIDFADSEWKTIRRNIQQDLWRKNPDLNITYIKQFSFKGNGLKVSNISTYSYEDQDGDLIPDSLEDQLSYNLHANGDLDGDGISNLDELINGELADLLKDTDGDGVSDLDELKLYLSDPFTIDHDGQVSEEIALDVENPSSEVGSWNKSNGISANNRRGSLEYDITVSRSGIYQLQLTVSQLYETAKNYTAPVHIYVDGVFVRSQNADLTYGQSTPVKCLTPYLSGRHKIKIVYDNVYYETSLKIGSMTLGKLGGPDTDENGQADWLDNYLKNSCTVDSYSISSKTSPAQICGKGRYLSLMSVNGVAPQRAAANRWYADVELDAHTSKSIDISWQGGLKTMEKVISWQETNVAEENAITIRKGDSLLLNAYLNDDDSASIAIGEEILGVTLSSPQTYKFEQAGVWQVEAQITSATGAVQDVSMTVKVVGVEPVDSPWVWQDKSRSWNWPGLNEGVILSADGMEFTQTESGYVLQRHEIKEDVNIVARLGENGPILYSLPTKGFWLRDVVEGVMFEIETFEDGSIAVTDTMFGVNLPEGAEIKLTANGAGIIFEDGTTVQRLTKDDFDELDRYTINMIKSTTRRGSVCHLYSVYQNGVLVGWGHK